MSKKNPMVILHNGEEEFVKLMGIIINTKLKNLKINSKDTSLMIFGRDICNNHLPGDKPSE